MLTFAGPVVTKNTKSNFTQTGPSGDRVNHAEPLDVPDKVLIAQFQVATNGDRMQSANRSELWAKSPTKVYRWFDSHRFCQELRISNDIQPKIAIWQSEANMKAAISFPYASQ